MAEKDYGEFKGIDFKNEPEETTPLSAENLNLIQQAIADSLGIKMRYADGNSIKKNNNNVNRLTTEGFYYMKNEDNWLSIPREADDLDFYLLILNKKSTESGYDGYLTHILFFVDVEGQLHIYSRVRPNPNSSTWTDWQEYNKKKEIVLNEIRPTGVMQDGKEIYVKRFYGGNLPNAGQVRIPIDISENITGVKVEGQSFNSNKNMTPIPYSNPPGAIYCYYELTSGQITVGSVRDRSTETFYIDFYFTYD